MRAIYIAVLVAVLVEVISSCDPFSPQAPIPGSPSCVGSTLTISGDLSRAQVNVFTASCSEPYSTVSKGYQISAQAYAGDYFEFALWHQETDGHCTLELGYNNGGSYKYLLDYFAQDQNGFMNDPTLLMPFYNYKKWYVRRFPIHSDFIGKQLGISFRCSAPPGNTGTRTFFVSRVRILTSGLETRANIPVECTAVSCNPSCVWNTGVCLDAGSSNYYCTCSEGYGGADCSSALCAAGCLNGGCTMPGTCFCSPGWSGALCDVPICATGCVNGGCSQPGQCNCNAGWQGALCDQAICSPTCNLAGATCNLPGECNCNQGWSGANCDQSICKAGCQYGTCQVAGECNCLPGWEGELCDTFVCTQGCDQGTCTGPNECTCNKGYSGDSCSIYCNLPKPSEEAECVVIDGQSVWVVNNTLIVNTTVTITTEVVVYGDLVITSEGVLELNNSKITVFGCLEIQNASSLIFTLTPEELALLDNNGALNRTVIAFDALCDVPNDFGQISLTNDPGSCAIVRSEQVSSPGLITVLVTMEKTACNINTPLGSGELVDWQIAVIVVACVVAAGAAILTGILVRKHQLAKEEKILSAKG